MTSRVPSWLQGELRRRLASAIGAWPGNRLWLVTFPAAPGDPEALWDALPDEPAVLWEPPESATWAGIGAARVFRGQGPDRFAAVQRDVARELDAASRCGVEVLPVRVRMEAQEGRASWNLGWDLDGLLPWTRRA